MVPCGRTSAPGAAADPPAARGRERKETTIAVQLIIENLAETTTESDLVALFSGVGRVRDVKLPTDRSTGDAKGFAYLLLATEAGAARAMERLNGYELDGSEIQVRLADDSNRRGGGPGGRLWGAGHAGSRPEGSRRGVRRRKRGL